MFFIPIFYIFQGNKLSDPIIIYTSIYYVLISAFCALRFLFFILLRRLIKHLGFIKWYSRLYRNQGSLFFRPPPLEWNEQIVIITGGASGIGELLANTLAVRSVTVVVLDINPIVTENCEFTFPGFSPKLTPPTYRQHCLL